MRIDFRMAGATAGRNGEYEDAVWFKLESFFKRHGYHFSDTDAENARRLIELMAGRRKDEMGEKEVLAAVRWAFERIRSQHLSFFLYSEQPTMIIEACSEKEPDRPDLKRLRQLILAMRENPDELVLQEHCLVS